MASPDIWFLVEQARFREERDALAALEAEGAWLTLGAWRLDPGCLVVELDIDVGHHVYEAQLRFPASYPHSPPVVRPRDPQALWSAHQYGRGGDLCLQIRPDNWSPDMRAAQVVASTFDLLRGENPAPDTRAIVPSDHRTTEGQRLRTEFDRLLVTRDLERQLPAIEPGQGLRGRHVASFGSQALVRIVSELQLTNESKWRDPSVPKSLATDCLEFDVYVRRLTAGEAAPSIERYEDFETEAQTLGWSPGTPLLLVADGDQLHAYRAFDGSVRMPTIIRPRAPETRLPPEAMGLAGKRVGIVGCGSLGSKVATTLARTGVGHFVLLDDDVMDPDNLVRNDLDWRGVGHHKVAALSCRLEQVHPGVEVVCLTRQLGGQESGSSAATDLARLADCDLIVDATANSVAANILSGFAQSRGIPVVWAEVFGGGIGGLVARCRPGKEPPMPLMRRAIENWFAARGSTAAPAPGPYAAAGDNPVLVADDADVSVMAAHAARVSLDVLLRPDQPHHPWPVYVIGLAPCALFEQPFEVHPIAMPDPPEAPPRRELAAGELAEENEFLGELLRRSVLPP